MIRYVLSIENIIQFIKSLIASRNLLIDLAKKDFKSRFTGSYLGIFWAFIHPVVTILILWFIFQVGFRAEPVNDYSYSLWLMSAMIPWFFFADSITGATTSITENSYLVKKIAFRVSTLPLTKIISSLFVHLVFIVILFIVFAAYGYYPNLYNLQIFYYLFALIIFILGISWFTSAIHVFIKDTGQIVSVFLQFGFWLTPIFWNFKIIPEKFAFYLKFNPILHITEGYRNCFIYKQWFWEFPLSMLFFWSGVLIIWLAGAIVFNKLRPHFADVL